MEEGQYDYAFANEELVTDNEKKEKVLGAIGGLIKHVATKVAEVGSDVGASYEKPSFNSDLNVPNNLSTSGNSRNKKIIYL